MSAVFNRASKIRSIIVRGRRRVDANDFEERPPSKGGLNCAEIPARKEVYGPDRGRHIVVAAAQNIASV